MVNRKSFYTLLLSFFIGSGIPALYSRSITATEAKIFAGVLGTLAGVINDSYLKEAFIIRTIASFGDSGWKNATIADSLITAAAIAGITGRELYNILYPYTIDAQKEEQLRKAKYIREYTKEVTENEAQRKFKFLQNAHKYCIELENEPLIIGEASSVNLHQLTDINSIHFPLVQYHNFLYTELKKIKSVQESLSEIEDQTGAAEKIAERFQNIKMIMLKRIEQVEKQGDFKNQLHHYTKAEQEQRAFELKQKEVEVGNKHNQLLHQHVQQLEENNKQVKAYAQEVTKNTRSNTELGQELASHIKTATNSTAQVAAHAGTITAQLIALQNAIGRLSLNAILKKIDEIRTSIEKVDKKIPNNLAAMGTNIKEIKKETKAQSKASTSSVVPPYNPESVERGPANPAPSAPPVDSDSDYADYIGYPKI